MDWIANAWRWLWDSTGFMPRRYCGPAWTAELVELSMWSNVAIWWCYVYLSLAAVAMWKLRLVLTLPAAILSWGFIITCGFTHWTQARMFTHPAYRLDVAAQVVCAAFSLATVGYLTVSCFRQVRHSRTQR